MNGIEVLRRLRNDPATRDLATVLLTASSDPSHLSDGADLGVLDYILKPFGHIDLARKLKALIRTNSPLLREPTRQPFVYPLRPLVG
jgi:DNA-binding response OmpR family regulator